MFVTLAIALMNIWTIYYYYIFDFKNATQCFIDPSIKMIFYVVVRNVVLRLQQCNCDYLTFLVKGSIRKLTNGQSFRFNSTSQGFCYFLKLGKVMYYFLPREVNSPVWSLWSRSTWTVWRSIYKSAAVSWSTWISSQKEHQVNWINKLLKILFYSIHSLKICKEIFIYPTSKWMGQGKLSVRPFIR